MSTRGCIARVRGDGFAGSYHQWDSYPSGLGKTLWHLYHGQFEHDLPRMLRALIDEHPAGWSNINDTDFRLTPGFVDYRDYICSKCGKRIGDPIHIAGSSAYTHWYERPIPRRPECYCHGARSEQAMDINEENAAGAGIEWVYVFHEDSRTINVLASFNADGSKMIGMFGQGNPRAKWRVVASVSMDGPEPDWDSLE